MDWRIGREQGRPDTNWRPAQPCEHVEVEIANLNSVRWHPLLEALRSRADERRSILSGRGQERELQFRDVILKGPHDTELLRARDLKRLLLAEFADMGIDFHTLSIRAGGDPSKIRAYFGNGVFAPEGADRQVADLQFCWSEPRAGAAVVTPMLDPQWPAAWYAGQMGVAIGFHNIITPAVLDGATADVNFTEASEQSYLYFGRRDRLTSPVVEAYCAGMHASVVCRTREWWLEDGLWQRADISIGPTSFPLWFRITSRTGDTTFHTGIQNQPDDDKARIVVRGLLLPELPSLLGLQRWLLSGEVSNWAVEFDSQGRLRASELSELAHSVVARWGTRFGVFQHRTSQWLPRRRAFGAQQNFDLSHGAQITRRYFPGRSVDAASRAWRNIYGRKWSLLQFVDQRPFGYFDVHPRATELVGAPVSGTAVRNLPSESEAEWLVGLDWLNCAAHVNVADQTIGLADYWCRLWRTQIDITPEHLEVWTSSLEQPAQSIRYRIAAGERGPLGPLYIEYK